MEPGGGKFLLVGNGGYETIQEAIDAAVQGDTVVVAAGIYDGDVTIDKDISIVGPNAGKTGSEEGRVAEAVIGGKVTITADGASLDGFTLTKAGTSIELTETTFSNWDMNSVLVQGDDVTLANNIIEVFGGELGKSGFVQLSGATTFTGNVVKAGEGYIAGNDARGASAVLITADTNDAVTVSNNHLLVSTNVNVDGDADALFLNTAGVVLIDDNVISGTDGGFVAYGDYGQLTFINNTIEGYSNTGLRIFESTNTTKPDVIVSGNTILESDAQIALVAGTVKLGSEGSNFPELSGNVDGLPAIYRANELDGDFGVFAGGDFSLFKAPEDAAIAAGEDGVIWNFKTAEFFVFEGMSIQAAVNVAEAGDTILVADGDYAQVVIDKGVTMKSVTEGGATINGNGTNNTGAVQIAAGVSGVTVDGFTIESVSGNVAGIHAVGDNSGITITNNTVLGAGEHAFISGDDGGDCLSDSSISGNSFTGSGPQPVVYVNGTTSLGTVASNVDFTGNTVTGKEGAGLLVGLESTGGEVTGNTFNGKSSFASLELWGAGTVVEDNTFEADGLLAISNPTDAYEGTNLVADNNFVGDKAVYIQETGNVYTTIQAAIDAAIAGSTIVVGAGAYEETVTLNKQLTILGAKFDVDGDAEGRGTGESALTGGIEFAAGSAGSVINGLQIQNGVSVLSQNAGIYVAANDVKISHMLIENDDLASAITSQARGITNVGSVTGLSVTDSQVSGFATGMYINPNSDAVVSGNVFLGNNVGLSNDFPSTASITGNTFEENHIEQIGIGAAGTSDVSLVIQGGNTFIGEAPEVSIFGSSGADVITGTQYSDRIVGGGGNDTFVFDDTDMGTFITDFTDQDGSEENADIFSYIGNLKSIKGEANSIKYQPGTTGTVLDEDTVIFELLNTPTNGSDTGLITALGNTAADAVFGLGDSILFVNYFENDDDHGAQVWSFVETGAAGVQTGELNLLATLSGVGIDSLGYSSFSYIA